MGDLKEKARIQEFAYSKLNSFRNEEFRSIQVCALLLPVLLPVLSVLVFVFSVPFGFVFAKLKIWCLGHHQKFIMQFEPLGYSSNAHPKRSSLHEAKETVKKGLNEAIKTGDNLKNQACSKTDEIFDESKETAQGVAERAKQVAQEAWGSAKGTAEKVIGKATEQSQGAVKDAAEMAKRSMNTKKDPNC